MGNKLMFTESFMCIKYSVRNFFSFVRMYGDISIDARSTFRQGAQRSVLALFFRHAVTSASAHVPLETRN